MWTWQNIPGRLFFKKGCVKSPLYGIDLCIGIWQKESTWTSQNLENDHTDCGKRKLLRGGNRTSLGDWKKTRIAAAKLWLGSSKQWGQSYNLSSFIASNDQNSLELLHPLSAVRIHLIGQYLILGIFTLILITGLGNGKNSCIMGFICSQSNVRWVFKG